MASITEQGNAKRGIDVITKSNMHHDFEMITDEEMTAIALCLFAFWNKTYYQSTSGIHRFKFVISMLSNFVEKADSSKYPDSIQQFLEKIKSRANSPNPDLIREEDQQEIPSSDKEL